MKTIKEWFKELPEEYIELALSSLDPDRSDTIEANLSDALAWGFVWSASKDSNGGLIWANLHLELISNGL